MRIDVRTEKGEARISMDYDKDAVAFVKRSFPNAKFDWNASEWVIPGKGAASRVREWIPLLHEYLRDIAYQEAVAKERFGSEKLDEECQFLTKTEDGWLLEVEYNTILFGLLKSVPGGRYEKRVDGNSGPWTFPFRSTETVRRFIPEITVLAEIALKQKAENDALSEEARQEKADRRALAKAAEQRERAAFSDRSAARRAAWVEKKKAKSSSYKPYMPYIRGTRKDA